MRIDKVYIEKFKNLQDFTIDINETKLHTVLLGQNAAGKSNFIEVIVLIFKSLDLEEETTFNYQIEYRCSNNYIKVVGGPKTKGLYQIFLGVKEHDTIVYSIKPLSKKIFKENKDRYLPKHIFSYYSGVSNRLLEYFDKHQVRFRDDLIKGIDHPIRKLFYARHIHSHFVLMSFFSFQDDKIQKFLSEYFNIIGLESILFVFKEPNWLRNKNPKDFWGAKGLVRSFLEELWEISMAPIVTTETIRVDFVKRTSQQQIYLYISNEKKLQKLADKYLNHSLFFKILESTYVSDLIQEVRIKVRKRDVDGNITFRELSEGEQQLLTVLGLIRFTKENESLFLLDEPDTHLNPLWKWRYMNLLQDVVGENDNSQILMTTHDPLVIGGLSKEEIRVFRSVKKVDDYGSEYQKVETYQPDFDPKGLGVAGILTSDFFNLPAAMDEETFLQLNRKRELDVLDRENKLNKSELDELYLLNSELSKIGFDKVQRDPLYEKFIQAVYENPDIQKCPMDSQERKIQNQKMADLLKEIMDEEKNI